MVQLGLHVVRLVDVAFVQAGDGHDVAMDVELSDDGCKPFEFILVQRKDRCRLDGDGMICRDDGGDKVTDVVEVVLACFGELVQLFEEGL